MRYALVLSVAALAVGVLSAATPAQAAATVVQAANDPYAAPVADAARRFDIPAAWIRAVMRAESDGDRRALSPEGAMGLMQIMPETWADLRDRYGLGSDPFDPRDNIPAGAAFLREMHDRYGSPGFLAAYNAGPERYEDYRDRHRPLPSETLAYVAELLPLLGDGYGVMPILATAPDPLAWTRAPLFIVRSADAKSAVRASLSQPPSGMPAVTAVRDLFAIAPQSNGLFIAVSAARPKP
jgi:hypothetical protein